MEHRLITGNYEFLPFARSCITKLKKLGLPYADQSFEIGGASIKVRIEPGHEYIRIEGGTKDYLVWPTSKVHRTGSTKRRSTVTITQKSLSVAGGPDEDVGRHDWIGSNGKDRITFDNGAVLRYHIDQSAAQQDGSKWMRINGKKRTTEWGVKGAAMFNKRPIYASYVRHAESLLPIRLVLYELGGVGEPDVEIARYSVPAEASSTRATGQIISQPTFFSGDGKKLITVLETIVVENLGFADYYFTPTRPYYIVRGSLNVDPEGNETFSFDTTEYATPEDKDNSIERSGVTSVAFSDPFNKFQYWNYHMTQDMSPGINPFYGTGRPAQDGIYVKDSHVRNTTTSRSRVVGADLTVDGEELVVTYTSWVGSESDTSGLIIEPRDTWLHKFYPETYDNFAYDVWITVSGGDCSGGSTHKGSLGSSVTYSINGDPLLVVSTDITTSTSTQTVHTATNSRGERYPYIVTTSTNTPRMINDVSVREIDARIKGIAVVVGSFNPLIPDNTPYTSKLTVKIDGDTHEKQVFSGTLGGDSPPTIHDAYHNYRVFASRREGEYLVCFSPADTKHTDSPVAVDYLDSLASHGTVDRTPLIAAKKEGKVVNVDVAVFKLGDEADFRFDPVDIN